jgi:hypothetical protein
MTSVAAMKFIGHDPGRGREDRHAGKLRWKRPVGKLQR